MKRRVALFVLVLLVPCAAFSQTPAPAKVPAQQPSPAYKTRAPEPAEGFGGMEYEQEGMPRQPMLPPKMPDLGKWWKNSDVVQELQLTEQQITQIEKNFLDHRLKLIDLKYDVERNEALLQPLIEADRPDEAKVGAQLDLLLAARGKLEKENAMMMLSIRRVLSVEQWKKLEGIQQGRERMRYKGPGPDLPKKMRQPMPAPAASTPPPAKPPEE